MKNKILKSTVSFVTAVCMLVGFSPLMQGMVGKADNTSPITARINGHAQLDGDNLNEIIKLNNLGSAPVESVQLIAGVIVESDFLKLKENNANVKLKSLTMINVAPAISSEAVFEGYPTNRVIYVPDDYISDYKGASDGNTDDDLWYGWRISKAANTPSPINLSEKQRISEAHVLIDAPIKGEAPQKAEKAGNADGYSIKSTTWDTSALSNGKFAPDTEYSTTIVLSAEPLYVFDSNASSLINGSKSNVTSKVSDDGTVMTCKVKFPKTTSQGFTDITVKISPKNTEIKQGSNKVFMASSTVNSVVGTSPIGNTPQTLKWSVTGNNSLLTKIDNNGLLTVADNESADILTVVAQSTIDSTKSASAYVKVVQSSVAGDENNSQPEGAMLRAVISPAEQTAVIGQTLNLTAQISGGTGRYTYQWSKDGVDINGATAPYYTKANISGIDGGTYKVTVTDDAMEITVSNSAVVTTSNTAKQKTSVKITSQNPKNPNDPVELTVLIGSSKTARPKGVKPTGTVSIKADDLLVSNEPVEIGADGKAVFSWKPASVGKYKLTVNYSGDDTFEPVETQVTYTNPRPADTVTTIPTENIAVIKIDTPVTGATPQVTVSDGSDYTSTINWYVGSAPIKTDNFYPGKSHKAVLTLTAKEGYVFANDAKASEIIAQGAEVKQEHSQDHKSIKITVTFPRTDNPNKETQEPLVFSTTMPTKKTYGDAEFAVAVKGGTGDGAVTFTSSDPKVLKVTTGTNGTGTVKIVGAGKATVIAKKAQGTQKDTNGDVHDYNETSLTSEEIVVAKRVLTAKANDKTIKIGDQTSTFHVSVSGFVNGDNEDNLDGYAPPTAASDGGKVSSSSGGKKPSSSAADTATKKYDITLSGGEPTSSYKFRYVTGTLTVSKTGTPEYSSNNTAIAKEDTDIIKNVRMGVTVKTDGWFDEGTELVVDNKTATLPAQDKKVYDDNIGFQSTGKKLAALYDIKLIYDNEAIQPDDEVKVTINLTNEIKNKYKNLEIAYIDEFANVTLIPCTVNMSTIEFYTDHFSYYAIVGTPIQQSTTSPPSKNPQTGDNMFFAGLAVVLGVVSFGTFAMAFKRKKVCYKVK